MMPPIGARRQTPVTPRAGVWIEMIRRPWYRPRETVTPRAGVWIEIEGGLSVLKIIRVTPRAGVWIEIQPAYAAAPAVGSLPVRECGLKCFALIV